MAPDKTSLGFLDIPAEIRDKIYRYVLVTPDFIDVEKMHLRGFCIDPDGGPASTQKITQGGSAKKSPVCELSAQLLRCNKQVHNEAFPILYGENTFHCNTFTFNISRLSVIRGRQYIQNIHFGNTRHLDGANRVSTVLGKFPNLRQVSLGIFYALHYPDDLRDVPNVDVETLESLSLNTEIVYLMQKHPHVTFVYRPPERIAGLEYFTDYVTCVLKLVDPGPSLAWDFTINQGARAEDALRNAAAAKANYHVELAKYNALMDLHSAAADHRQRSEIAEKIGREFTNLSVMRHFWRDEPYELPW